MRLLAGFSLAAVFLVTVSLSLRSPSSAEEDAPIRVELVAEHGDTGTVEALVRELGGEVQVTSADRVQALVPPSAVDALEASPIAEVDRPGLFVPLQVVPATTLIGSDLWNAAGFTGFGVKVAILDAGFQDYQASLGTSLPPEVVAQSFRSDGNIGGGTVHGRRAAEVVHSVAPGAQLYLVNFGTVTELSAAVDYLIAEGVDIVSFSLGYIHNGPGDGTGPVNEVVSRSIGAGQTWSVASGNWAQQHWNGPFQDDDGDTIHEFAGEVEMNAHQFAAGDQITVSVRWDEPWGEACSDYDIELFGPSGALVRAARAIQNCDDDPVESLQVLAIETGTYTLRIIEAHAPDGPRTLDVMMVGTPDRGNPLSVSVPEGSLSEPADHSAVVTVGALTISEVRTEASYSSRGPTADGRFKPNLLSPTGAGNSSPSSSFGGTSAAAPHVAGAMALLKEAFPDADRQRIQSLIQARAISVAPTPDASGARRLDMGSLLDVGPLLPQGSETAQLVGEIPESGIAVAEYAGPDGYPLRFIHLLVDFREVRTVFAFDPEDERWRAFSSSAPAWVNSLRELDAGQTVYVFFNPFD